MIDRATLSWESNSKRHTYFKTKKISNRNQKDVEMVKINKVHKQGKDCIMVATTALCGTNKSEYHHST